MTPEERDTRESVEMKKEGYRAAHRFVHRRLVALGWALPLTWVSTEQAAIKIAEAMIAYTEAYRRPVTVDVIEAALFFTPQEMRPE
jgi:hypothetical protein